jgi:cell surface protein SprA
MNLDNLNAQLDYSEKGDGMYDFIEGVTVISQSGRIIFPVLEPFGSNIADKLSDENHKKKYAFSSLYNTTKVTAEQDFDHNKYYLVGSYKGSSSSEIVLNTFNLAPGSVKVSAGSQVLVENIDYTVDYALGRVKIINDSYINSGTPIQVSTESQDLISMQRKTMIGTYASYAASEKLNIGGTMLYMNERPITTKVDMGEEPVSNLMLGLDMQYRTRSKFLTDLVNLIPFYNSKTESSLSIEAEVAKLFPGQSRTTGNNVYIDDFEGIETNIPLSSAYGWALASTPQKQPWKFPEAEVTDSLIYGYNRAKLSWYHIDRSFSEKNSSTMPAHIKTDLEMLSNHYMRSVGILEIFPGRSIVAGSVAYQNVLNLSYFPKERGPYNYDVLPVPGISKGINSDGQLNDPHTRWGGIMRNIETPNFETANIEFIEFWLLDPFIYDQGTHRGGDLYFNLGSISEDILKDSRKSFENGLPTNESGTNFDYTAWGRVSTDQLLKQAFTESDAESRRNQDVGLDGLHDDLEREFFSDFLEQVRGITTEEAYNKIFADPSADNFRYHKGDEFDAVRASIIDRYKFFNGHEGNTPVNPQDNDGSNRSEPDIEDLNRDNTLNENEAYYQYRVSIRPEDMEIGKYNIVDKVNRKVRLANGKEEYVNWYQFKIPVRKPDEVIGDIYDFKSIRFIRMYLNDFSDSIILRFGTLALVRSEWRKELKSISEPGSTEALDTEFDMTTINIEENSARKPINYILPPGIEREVDPTSYSATVMNEQSMLLKVKNLGSGDAKAVYKNVGIDMRQYKRLKMEVHAEAIEGHPLSDNEISLFVRLGSDYDNYYEYEIPLKLTPIPATPYNGEEINSPDRYIVWPDENRLDLDLSVLPQVKMNRDELARRAGSTVSRSEIYEEAHTGYQNGKNKIKVKGNPSIGEVEVLHIGIRNPKNAAQLSRSVEVWVNELRLSDFDVKGGWASTGRMSLRLADLGNISLSGRTQSVGWGSINQAPSQRSLENMYQYDIAANVELGKLLPEKVGLHLPVFYNYSKNVSNPEYNPLSSDVKMVDALAAIESPEEKDYLKEISQTISTRESFTLNNISIEPQREKADRKPLPTDIENFSLSYAYSKQEARSVDIEKQLEEVQRASFDYNYAIQSKPIEPFKSVKFFDNNYLRIIKDFNFSLLPELISFRTDLLKNYSQRQARDNTGLDLDLPVTVQKNFLWNRSFDFRYNITRNLRMDFSNKNVNRIDQMDGIEDRFLYPDLYSEIQRDLWEKIQTFGRPVDYQHTINATYNVPINKLPFLDFTSARVTYRGNYDWNAGPLLNPEVYKIDVGNTIRNGMNINGSGQLNLTTLYNKVPYFKQVDQRFQTTTRRYGSRNQPTQRAQPAVPAAAEGKTKEVKYNEKKVSFKENIPKSIFHRLGTEKVKVAILSSKGDTIKGTLTIVNENRVNFKTEKDIDNAQIFIVGTVDNSEPFAKKMLDATTRVLLGVRSVRASYTLTGGTEMPGFLGVPQAFHFGSQQMTSQEFGPSLAPGLPFLLGWQNPNFALMAADKGWITKDTIIVKQFLNQRSETWNFGIQIEPFSNIKIDVSGNRRESTNMSSFLKYNEGNGSFELYGTKETGNFDISIFTLRTAFNQRLSDSTAYSELFEQFRGDNRSIIAARLNELRGYEEGVGYTKSPDLDGRDGISLNSSDVIIPAFIAAYTGTDAAKVPLTARPGLAWIRPNWRINYNGDPQNINWMRNIFTSFNIIHSYRATYTVGRFETNLAYRPDQSGLSWVRTQFDNLTFVPQLDIGTVTIQEDFSPLINVDVGFVNDLSASFEIRRSRALNFSFSNMQLSEMMKSEYTIGMGYRFTGLDMIIKTRRKSEKVSNDINMRLDIGTNNFKTTFRKIDETNGILQSGTQLISINYEADYMISDKLTIKFYYMYKFQNPHLKGGSDGYLQKDTRFGLSFNYSIM